MRETLITFGPWAPDHPSYGGMQLQNGGPVVLEEAFGVYHTIGGYRPYLGPGTTVASFSASEFPEQLTPNTASVALGADVWLDDADRTTLTLGDTAWNQQYVVQWRNKIDGKTNHVDADPINMGGTKASPDYLDLGFVFYPNPYTEGKAVYMSGKDDSPKVPLSTTYTGTTFWAIAYCYFDNRPDKTAKENRVLFDIGNDAEYGANAATSAVVRLDGSTYNLAIERNGETTAVSNTAITVETQFMVFIAFDGTDKFMRLNGVETARETSTGAFNITQVRVGNRGNVYTASGNNFEWHGGVREMVFGTGTLTSTEIEELEGWLLHKRGNTSLLDDSHPFKAQAPLTSASANVANEPTSTGVFWSAAGNAHMFIGDYTKLYKLNMGTDAFDDVTKTGASYLATRYYPWQFTQFGDRIIATTKFDTPQYYDLDVSSLFADLPGSPPKARCCAQVRDFVFLGSTIEAGTELRYRVRWSGFNDSEDWTTDPGGTQADFQDMDAQYGEVMAIIGGEFATILQERAITRFTYVGPPAIFQRDTIEINRGTIAPLSVIKVGGLIYFYSHDGFWAFDGAASRRISGDLIHRWMKARQTDERAVQMRVGHDPDRRIIIWAWPHDPDGLNRATAGYQLLYNYDTGNWSYYNDVNLRWWSLQGPLEESYIDNDDTPIDNDPNEIDTGRANYTRPLALAYDGELWRLQALDGGDLLSKLETASMSINPGRRSLVTGGRVVGNIDSTSVVYFSVSGNGAQSTKPASADFEEGARYSANSGFFPSRAEGRYHAIQITWDGGKGETTGDSEELDVIQGVSLEYQPLGMH